jgi:type 2 lantibiotic biosynthesis protein LanM
MAVHVTEKANREEMSGDLAWYPALTLGERLATPPLLVSADGRERGARRMQRWRSQIPFASETRLSEWLCAHALTVEDLTALLGESPEALRLRAGAAPDWVRRLAATRTHDQSIPTASTAAPATAAANALDAFGPCTNDGIARVRRRLAELAHEYATLPFDPAGVLPLLLANLSGQLLPILGRTIALELNVARVQGRLHGDSPEERFQHFFKQLSDGAIWPLLEEYPVLARQVAKQTEHWAHFSLEVLEHLCRDWPLIGSTFSPRDALGPLVEISGGAGDTHRQGRSVLKLTFGSGRKLIYKPRSLALDVHFNELLAWLNERGDHPPFRLTTVLERGNYGWVEFIVAGECETVAEVERFYQRQGGYLALLYLLNATDFHYENLIAAGEDPVLIDLEALFHASLSATSTIESDDPAFDKLAQSVMLTGLLPQRSYGDSSHAGVDLSGLNGQAGQLSPRPALRWQDAGTDTMRAVRERLELPGQHNRPRLKGEDIGVLDHAAQLRDGFAAMYRLVMRHREELIAGPLTRFAADETRVLLRPTNAYARLLQEGHHPDLLREALDRERFFGMLWAEHSRLSRLIPFELADLWNGDIPIFTGRPESRDVFDSRGERIPDVLAEPGLARVAARLIAMDESDLAQQIWIIDASIASTPLGEGRKYWRNSHTAPGRLSASRDQLLHAAGKVGDRLCDLAVHGADGANWLTLSIAHERDWHLTTTGIDLYDGLPGIILTLAHLGRLTGENRYAALAHASLRTLRRKTLMDDRPQQMLGAFSGWGSLVYLYSHLSGLWHDESLLSEAIRVAMHVDSLVEQDEALDIIGGSAGAILALLSLHRVTLSPSVLAIAAKCGTHLIDKAQPMAAGLGWVNSHTGTVPMAGFSHGAAGIAFSLLALAEATGIESFRRVAQSGIAYERSLFSAEHQNWPALRDSVQGEDDDYRATWCHGAAGIGLARLAGMEYWRDAMTAEEIRVASLTTLECGFDLNHSLCHGDFGNLELLLSLSRLTPDSDHRDQLNNQVITALDSVERHGYLAGTPMALETPGLMTGIAGIGYQLMRLAEPDRVPAVLLLAPPSDCGVDK